MYKDFKNNEQVLRHHIVTLQLVWCLALNNWRNSLCALSSWAVRFTHYLRYRLRRLATLSSMPLKRAPNSSAR
jgi:hypothetical protein